MTMMMMDQEGQQQQQHGGGQNYTMEVILPVLLLFVTAIIDLIHPRKDNGSMLRVALTDLALAIVIWFMLPLPSITPWWGPLTFILSHWPVLFYKIIKIINDQDDDDNRQQKQKQKRRRQKKDEYELYEDWWLVHGGPLGYGCSKVMEIVVATILWRTVHGQWPEMRLLTGPISKKWYVWSGIIIIVLSAAVNFVLYAWSRVMQSRGDHHGVNEMIESTKGRTLTWNERGKILCSALANATCEEIAARWFWREEFGSYFGDGGSSGGGGSGSGTVAANVCQAVVFGIEHYHGVPSGIPGIILTFTYGLIMGMLQDYSNHNLLLPIIAHTIADYYIFAVIVRQNDVVGGGDGDGDGRRHDDKSKKHA